VRRVITLAALAAGLLAGCGSDEPTADRGRANPEPAETVAIQAAEGGFDAQRVFRESAPGVITVRSVFAANGDIFSTGPRAAEGSGFVLNDDGEIITNAHVVTSGRGCELEEEINCESRIEAERVFVEFPDRNIVPAEIVGTDPFYDVALLRVDPEGLDLSPLELGDDSELVVGQPVAAIGSPFGEQQSLSIGIVSATDRSVRSLTEFQIEGAIQTDASINPGNSGGPLLDAAGRVIGINQQIETRSGANDGVGFAVPVSAVRRSVEQLREEGEVSYAYIGVSSQPLYPQLAERLDIDARFGGMIADVVDGGPADEAGLRGGEEEIRFQAATYQTGGDVIVAVEGRQVRLPDDLARLIADFAPGDEIVLEIIRDGERQDVDVTLGERPESSTEN
jgi:S1-C subfamily serine protease